MQRSPRDPVDARRILIRKARAFAERGHDHLAEQSINNALRLGAPVEDVSDGLSDLRSRGATFTRREALKGTAVLLGAGVVAGSGVSGMLDRHSARPATSGHLNAELAASVTAEPSGIYVKVPSNTGDGTHALSRATSSGLVAIAGAYAGYSFVSADQQSIVNVAQSWDTGAPQTTVRLIGDSGVANTFVLAPSIKADNAAETLSRTTAIARGKYLFCAHTCGRIYVTSTSLPVPKSSKQGLRVTTQHLIEVVSLETGALVATWIGPTVEGACHTALKVRSDGSELLLAVDMPGAAPTAALHHFAFDGAALSLVGTRVPGPELLYAVAGSHYDWRHDSTNTMTQVGVDAVHVYRLSDGSHSSSRLPMEFGNNRKPVNFQAVFLPSSSVVISNGDGRILSAGSSTAAARVTTTLPGSTLSPPFLAYQGPSVHDVWASTADGSLWLIDNREGIGGLWKLDPKTLSPTVHFLPSNYCSGCTTDFSGAWLAALNPLESAMYLLPAGSTSPVAVSVDPTAALLPRS